MNSTCRHSDSMTAFGKFGPCDLLSNNRVSRLLLSQRIALAAFTVTRPRSTFGGGCPKFRPHDSDTDASRPICAPSRTHTFDLVRLQNCGLRGAPTKAAAAATQTAWFGPVVAAALYGGFDQAARRGAPDGRLLAFLAKALRLVGRALLETEGVDIFRDAFARLGGDEPSAEQGKGEGGLK